ncbi:TIGR03089 family protein [Streptomyces sp. NP160]|uniref:TIGR03089 family protein n=1 Tax=Streptomyces sp. NP160 TaxID=2586637 RepID=UPI001117DA03|nr:TIGR03089 family protein [Streptomyces sp. NP160]TNM68736.1 TIGR03089 family protein [Streptomyces sp. NP160]
MSSPSARVDVTRLLDRLRAQDSGRPRVTWYGADGERVELSARVLENWVAKTANLLVEELDVETGDGVLLALPAHWRTVAWRLALGAVGAELVEDDDDARVAVVADGAPAPTGAEQVVVQALGALALRATSVPAGALDAAAVVAGFGDALPFVPDAPGLQVSAAASPGARVLVDVREVGDAAALDAVLSALAGGGSAVLLGPGAPDADRIAAQEGTAPSA